MLNKLWKIILIGKVKNMKRIVLYREDSYIIVQHISDTGVKYPPMTIRRKRMKTQYEADLFRTTIKPNKLIKVYYPSHLIQSYSFYIRKAVFDRRRSRTLVISI